METSEVAAKQADLAATERSAGVVRADALIKFAELVRDLGGNPAKLLRSVQIDESALSQRNAVISYRSLAQLLERSAATLDCPHFALRLASVQGGAKVLGPLEVAMKNSRTLGDAFTYCSDHVHAYSPVTQIALERQAGTDRSFLRFDILMSRLSGQPYAVEHALLLTQHAARSISSGAVSAREIWLAHEPLADPAAYRQFFGAIVRFSQPASGLFFNDRELALPLLDSDPQLFEMATTFIDSRFPPTAKPITARVRSLIERFLIEGNCSNENVASAIGMHPRTMQRRLREEGQCVETLKDEIRRDMAYRYLRQPQIPLLRIAEMLGYSETSVLSRSCLRWFNASPRKIREALAQNPDVFEPDDTAWAA